MKPVISELARALDRGLQDLCGFVSFFFFFFSLLWRSRVQERLRKWRKHRDVRRELSKAFRKLSSPWIVTHEMRLGRSSANYSQHLAIECVISCDSTGGYFRVPLWVEFLNRDWFLSSATAFLIFFFIGKTNKKENSSKFSNYSN